MTKYFILIFKIVLKVKEKKALNIPFSLVVYGGHISFATGIICCSPQPAPALLFLILEK